MFRCCKGAVEVSFGFCLLLLWFAAANGWRMLAEVMLAAVVHELGHALALRAAGAEVRRVRLSVFGAEMETRWTRLSYAGEAVSILAGPGANLLCGLIFAALGYPVAAGANLVLCGFNLIPVRPLDGGRALELAVSWAAGPAAAAWAVRWIGGCAAVALATVAFWLMWRTGGSLWLAPAAAGLLGAAAGEMGLFVK